MTDLTPNNLKMLNLFPSNKAATEVLRSMGRSPHSAAKLAILEFALAKGTEELDHWADPMLDLADLNRHLTPAVANLLTKEMDVDPEWLHQVPADELITSIMDTAAGLLPFAPRTLQ